MYGLVDTFGPRFYVRETSEAHPRGRVFVIDVSKPDLPRTVVVPEGAEVLRRATIVGGRILARYLVVGCTKIQLFSLEGKSQGELALPGLGTARGFGGDDDDTETFYTWTDFTTPASIHRLDLTTGKASVFRAPKVDFDGTRYETRQVFATSRDGTRVPVFVVHKKGLKLDGSHPALLAGYGGFRSVTQPRFSVPRAVWLEMGGVYATAGLRGGSEYGEDWHRAGMLERKQNVYDDFIAAAEMLAEKGYTSSRRLAIAGTSNGGLLVGAVLNQRPDLFGAALPAVGVMDMLRFHRFTIGWAWTREYGSPEDPAMFPHLLAYSPYHNIRRGVAYPPTLITTSDHDDRVVPAHSFKYAARLQSAQVGGNPILLRVETKGGHGGGLAMQRVIEAAVDRWSFLAMALGMK
jgi:prolyl oligopeptidase